MGILMTCKKCGFQITEFAKFCQECGSSITNECANCGTQLQAGDNFCTECATPSSAARDQAVRKKLPIRLLGNKLLGIRNRLLEHNLRALKLIGNWQLEKYLLEHKLEPLKEPVLYVG